MLGFLSKITAFLLCLSLIFLAVVRLLFPFLAFHPDRELRCTPTTVGLAYQDVPFMTKDGIQLHGWYIPVEPSRGVVLFCHGNAGNIGHRLESIGIFHDLGLSVLIFDYRGYGRSQGSSSVKGLAVDAKAAWDWLVYDQKISPDEIVLFGRSLGGAIALELTKSVAPKGIILESTFASPFGLLPIGLIAPLLRTALGNPWDSLSAARELDIPTLCIHSPDDEIVPFREGQKLYDAVMGEKSFVEIKGGHNDSFMMSISTYVPALDDFLTRLLGPR
ncbi:MAG: alpha/beta hydrolase [Dethiosulfovibrio peptidovorans]|nr:MAG: alpha/beta hydrolase [Dethiosulfovibrio peptidovorans]